MMLGDLGKGEFHLSPPPSSSSATSPSSSSQYNPMVVPQKSRSDGGGGDHEGGHGSGGGEKEHMFDKVVTPSDVGKLNRLVIPKQYAEKYFPVDWTVNEKGLLLNFEDRVGKPWRFRYSYWNSSQSYVMTKGWSRFVKEKKLDAGDVVSFQRGVGELGKDHFYIDWKHRLGGLDALGRSVPFGRLFVPPASLPYLHSLQQQNSSIINFGACGYNVAANHGSAPLFYNLRSGGSAQVGSGGDNGSFDSPMAIDGVRAVHGNATGKRLRLFGVNMECSTGTIPGDDDDNNGVGNLFPPAGMRITRPLTMLPSPPSHPPVKLMLFNGVPLPAVPSQLSRKGKQPLSLDLGI